jgi:integrase
MGVNIWLNRNQVYLDIYTRGQRKREKLEGLVITGDRAMDKETMRLAEIAKAKRAQQVFSEEWGLVNAVAQRQPLYSYISKNNDKSKKSRWESTNSALKHLKEYPGGGNILLSQINEKWIKGYEDWLLGRFAPASAGTYAAVVRAALNRAMKENILVKNPALNVARIKAPESKPIWLNAEELRALANIRLDFFAGEEMQKAFLFACYTGLRISDIKTLTWNDIEYSPLQVIKRQKKTAEQVYIPLAATAWALINDGSIHNHRSPVFPQLSGIDHCHYKRLEEWAKKAGIKKHIGWHTARHTFAVMALEGGADLYTVSKLLGHKNIATTQIYAQATDKLKRAAVAALPAVEIRG